jgi:colanic acid/amylovoran biosynthesis protein
LDNAGCDNIKIVITGFYTAANRGDEGILRGMINAFSQNLKDVDVKVLAHHDIVTSDLTGLKTHKPLLDTERAALLPFYILQMIYLTLWTKIYSMGIFLPLGSRKESVKALMEADLVLVSGGGFLNDNYKPAILGRLFELFFAYILKKPVGIYAHSLGPFNTRFYRLFAKMVFNRMNIITVREKISSSLLEEMKIHVPIRVVPDAAFGMPLNTSYDEEFLSQLVQDEKEMVSISVRDWEYYSSERGHEKYIDTIANVADSLSEDGYGIIFCSTCTGYGGYAKDDRVTAEEVRSRMKHKEDVLMVGEHLGPGTLIQIYSKMKFHIGTRMHSNIYALLAKTPVVAIGYEHKTMGMMERLGLEDQVVDINDIAENEIHKKVDNVISNYEEFKNKISAIIPEVRKEAIQTPVLIMQSLNDPEFV